MSSVTISYRYNHQQGNSFLNIIYFYQKIKGECCCITKKKLKNTRVSVLKIYEYSIF